MQFIQMLNSVLPSNRNSLQCKMCFYMAGSMMPDPSKCIKLDRKGILVGQVPYYD